MTRDDWEFLTILLAWIVFSLAAVIWIGGAA